MKNLFSVGDKVVYLITDIHNVNVNWADVEARGVGEVIEQTPYKVHVSWETGEEMAHNAEILVKVKTNDLPETEEVTLVKL